jgi:RHS repeat-associated protein
MAKVNPYRFSTKFQDDETDLVYYGYRYYNPAAGRWASRDPMGESGGLNLFMFSANNPVQFIDLFGLKWQINRAMGDRAVASCDCGDTWDALARKIHFDTSDYTIWAQTTDRDPVPGKQYTIPNTIYVDYGAARPWDYAPGSIFSIWRHYINQDVAQWGGKGFRVVIDEGVIDQDIVNHLHSANIYGYVFVGHGDHGGIIGSYSPTNPGNVGTGPDRYTPHGIAFLTLNSCYSADSVPVIRKHYRYNAWESNVATRGWFKGYTGEVNTIDEFFLWAVAPGKNDNPFRVGQ